MSCFLAEGDFLLLILFCFVERLLDAFVMINVNAPSPVMLQAVPKLSCKANIVSRRAVPASSNPRTEITIPSEAITVPPGTPGAPMAKMPSRMMNRIMTVNDGSEP